MFKVGISVREKLMSELGIAAINDMWLERKGVGRRDRTKEGKVNYSFVLFLV